MQLSKKKILSLLASTVICSNNSLTAEEISIKEQIRSELEITNFLDTDKDQLAEFIFNNIQHLSPEVIEKLERIGKFDKPSLVESTLAEIDSLDFEIIDDLKVKESMATLLMQYC